MDWAEHLNAMEAGSSPSNFDFDMDIPMSPAAHSLGGVSGLSCILEPDVDQDCMRKPYLDGPSIIDLTPECLEYSKLAKAKVLLTLDRGIDRGGISAFAIVFISDFGGDEGGGET